MNGKAKGSSFEREISKEMDVWWKEIKGTFWRTKNSGGIDEPGDIAPRYRPQHKEKIWWPFVVECKHYKQLNLLNLFRKQNKNNQILTWWRQVTREQEQCIKEGHVITPLRLLIIKPNTFPTLCVFSKEEFLRRATESVRISGLKQYFTFYDINQDVELVITCFDNFKEHFTRERLESLFKHE